MRPGRGDDVQSVDPDVRPVEKSSTTRTSSPRWSAAAPHANRYILRRRSPELLAARPPSLSSARRLQNTRRQVSESDAPASTRNPMGKASEFATPARPPAVPQWENACPAHQRSRTPSRCVARSRTSSRTPPAGFRAEVTVDVALRCCASSRHHWSCRLSIDRRSLPGPTGHHAHPSPATPRANRSSPRCCPPHKCRHLHPTWAPTGAAAQDLHEPPHQLCPTAPPAQRIVARWVSGRAEPFRSSHTPPHTSTGGPPRAGNDHGQ